MYTSDLRLLFTDMNRGFSPQIVNLNAWLPFFYCIVAWRGGTVANGREGECLSLPLSTIFPLQCPLPAAFPPSCGSRPIFLLPIGVWLSSWRGELQQNSRNVKHPFSHLSLLLCTGDKITACHVHVRGGAGLSVIEPIDALALLRSRTNLRQCICSAPLTVMVAEDCVAVLHF